MQLKSAFTMIELIFVIVIIGILAGVAVPKMLGVSHEANSAIVQSFVGSLNRSAGSSMWSRSLSKGYGGSIQNTEFCGKLEDYIEIPKQIKYISGQNDCNTSNLDVNTSSGATGSILLRYDGNLTYPPSWKYIK